MYFQLYGIVEQRNFWEEELAKNIITAKISEILNSCHVPVPSNDKKTYQVKHPGLLIAA